MEHCSCYIMSYRAGYPMALIVLDRCLFSLYSPFHHDWMNKHMWINFFRIIIFIHCIAHCTLLFLEEQKLNITEDSRTSSKSLKSTWTCKQADQKIMIMMLLRHWHMNVCISISLLNVSVIQNDKKNIMFSKVIFAEWSDF